MCLTRRVALRYLRNVVSRKKVEYVGIFLGPMERKRLLQKFPPIHKDVRAHHMTIWNHDNGGKPEFSTLPLGKTVPLKVVGYVADDKGQAVVVDVPSQLRPRSGQRAHITISVAPGTKAVYSNALISKGWDALSGSISLKGKVGWWGGKRVWF